MTDMVNYLNARSSHKQLEYLTRNFWLGRQALKCKAAPTQSRCNDGLNHFFFSGRVNVGRDAIYEAVKGTADIRHVKYLTVYIALCKNIKRGMLNLLMFIHHLNWKGSIH